MIDNKILSFRKALNLSRMEMSKRLNISDKTILAWENNGSNPAFEHIYNICKEYSIPSEYFFEDNIEIRINPFIRYRSQGNAQKRICDEIFILSKPITLENISNHYSEKINLLDKIYRDFFSPFFVSFKSSKGNIIETTMAILYQDKKYVTIDEVIRNQWNAEYMLSPFYEFIDKKGNLNQETINKYIIFKSENKHDKYTLLKIRKVIRVIQEHSIHDLSNLKKLSDYLESNNFNNSEVNYDKEKEKVA